MTPMISLIFAQLESMSNDKDRVEGECVLLKTHLRELKAEFERLYKIKGDLRNGIADIYRGNG